MPKTRRMGSSWTAGVRVGVALTAILSQGCDADLRDMNRCYAWARAVCGASCVDDRDACVEAEGEDCRFNFEQDGNRAPDLIDECVDTLRDDAGSDFSECANLPDACRVSPIALWNNYGVGDGALVPEETMEDDPSAGGAGGSGGRAGAGAGGSGGRNGAGGSSGRPSSDVRTVSQGSTQQIDFLFMVDNSSGMAGKQRLLGEAVPQLLQQLLLPGCVDDSGTVTSVPSPGQPCPAGSSPQSSPVYDINVGVVSSSLGDVGASVSCAGAGSGNYVPERIDLAHLLGSLPRGQGTANTTEGFLAWRAGADVDLSDAERMLVSAGENGCVWEASLESWYRFLVDPFPYQALVRVACLSSSSPAPNCVQPLTDVEGRIVLDATLLQQRAAFLRPDSLVVVVMLSDENDCSIQVGNQTWIVAAVDRPTAMFRGSSTCNANANDKCCYSCPLGPPAGCSEDPICQADPDTGAVENRLPAEADGNNLRCFDQKRRFGVDFLYPTSRYVNALTQPTLCWNESDLSTDACDSADIVQNPLFTGRQDPSKIILAGVVGVPWQAIASTNDAQGRPLANPATQLRFKSAAELNSSFDDTWNQILGSPGTPWRSTHPDVPGIASVPPSMPQMIESDVPRANIDGANDINGREYETVNPAGIIDDLEYACIFPLAAARDCSLIDPEEESCDCFPDDTDRPLCEELPGLSEADTIQYWDKAYPGLRQLDVLRQFGDNSVVASICPRNVSDIDAPDYGYHPAMDALLERVRANLTDRCLAEPLPLGSDGVSPCQLVEANVNPSGACVCDASLARRTPSAALDASIRAELASSASLLCGEADPSCSGPCLCEVLQVQDVTSNPANALERCLEESAVDDAQGWCYIDPARGAGATELVTQCPALSQRRLRVVGQATAPGLITLVSCPATSN